MVTHFLVRPPAPWPALKQNRAPAVVGNVAANSIPVVLGRLIVFLGLANDGQTVFLVQPPPQVDLPAALAAKRSRRGLVGIDLRAASWARKQLCHVFESDCVKDPRPLLQGAATAIAGRSRERRGSTQRVSQSFAAVLSFLFFSFDEPEELDSPEGDLPFESELFSVAFFSASAPFL